MTGSTQRSLTGDMLDGLQLRPLTVDDLSNVRDSHASAFRSMGRLAYPEDEVAAFASEFDLTFSIWLDPHSKALEAFQNWDLPSSYLIDRDGNVLYTWIGAVNQQTLEKYVTPLLNR